MRGAFWAAFGNWNVINDWNATITGWLHDNRGASSGGGSFVTSNGQGGATLQFGNLSDGRPNLFALDSTGTVWNMWKTSTDPNSTWSTWQSFGNSSASIPFTMISTGRFSDGRLALFAIDKQGTIWNSSKSTTDASSTWTAWTSLGQAGIGVPSQVQVGMLSNGQMNIFITDGSGIVWNIWQTSANPQVTWSGWQATNTFNGGLTPPPPSPTPAFSTTTLIFGILSDGRPDLFTLDGNGEVWNMWKTTADQSSLWSGWYPISTP